MVLADKYNWLVQIGKNHSEIFESVEIEKQNKKIITFNHESIYNFRNHLDCNIYYLLLQEQQEANIV